MSKPLAFSLTAVAAIVFMTAIVFVAVLTRDSDGIEVKFDAMNATFEVDCISPWEDEGGPVPFADGEWGDDLPSRKHQRSLHGMEEVEGSIPSSST